VSKDWVEEQLENRGIILMAGMVDDEMSARVTSQIIAYNMKGGLPRIQIIINSEGGLCTAGF